MRIPILDLTPELEKYGEAFTGAFQRVLASTQFVMGPEGKAFETEVAKYLGINRSLGLNSGTDALVIGLRALGLGPGDEVICPSFTFFATAEAISAVGATPVFADVDLQTFCLDPQAVEQKVSAKTKALIPVHLFGHAAEMQALQALAQKHHLFVLEDVAQAMGGSYQGKRLGTFGHLAAFSFFPSKNLGALGDGGLIATNDEGLAERCGMLRAHGSKVRYFNEMIGYNSRLDEIQAALLRIKLTYLETANDGRRLVAKRYNEAFTGMAGIIAPVERPQVRHVYHQYTLRITNGKRDKVQRDLAERGIATMIYYPVPVHQLPVYAAGKVTLPITEQLAAEVISLPIWPQMTAETQLEVIHSIQSALS